MHEKIVLSFGNHCIETAAKNEYRRLLNLYFSGNCSLDAVEREMELLVEFLETGDFSALRASDERLAGNGPVRVEIFKTDDGSFAVNIR